jgi:hypothetical protein
VEEAGELVGLEVEELAAGVGVLEVAEVVVYRRICAEVGLSRVHPHQMTLLPHYEASMEAFLVEVWPGVGVLRVKFPPRTDTDHNPHLHLSCLYRVEVG